jgi:hypothetical protein
MFKEVGLRERSIGLPEIQGKGCWMRILDCLREATAGPQLRVLTITIAYSYKQIQIISHLRVPEYRNALPCIVKRILASEQWISACLVATQYSETTVELGISGLLNFFLI